MEINNYRVFLYKPEAVSVTADSATSYFLGELIVDNLDVSIKLQDISTVNFTMPRFINSVANTRIDEVLDGYVIELWYGNLTGTVDVDYYRYRFTIYSTPVNFSDNKFLHNYTGYSLEALTELKMLVSWSGIEISDFYRKISYNNTEATPKFLEPKDTVTGGNFEYTITTSGSGADYISVVPTTAVATDVDIFIYEVRQRLSSGDVVSESEAGLIPYSGTGPDDAEFKNGYYFLTISGGYVTQIDIALPDNYTDFNGESVSSHLLFFKLYDNPLSRRYAIGITTNAEQANDMYIDLAHDVAEGNPTDYDDFNFQTQTFYSKNGLTLKQVLLGKENTSTTTITEDGLLYNTGFGLGTIHSSLLNLYRSNLEFNNVTRYQAIKTLAESFDAIAIYDTVNNTVSFYPENIYGINNGLIITYGAYLKSLNKEIDASKIITNAIGLGKDNLTINLVNPTGLDYWEDYSYYLDDYYISSSSEIENITEDGDEGIVFDYVSTTGYQSRWMSVSLAEKVAKWQYTRDWFHSILTGDYNPTGFTSTITQFYNFYENRLQAIRLLIKQETEYFNALKREVKFEAFKNYYDKLSKDNPGNSGYADKLAYYTAELAAAKTHNAALKSDLEDARNDIFDPNTAGSYAAKMAVLQGYLQKDSAARNINLDSLRPFQRETVVNDNAIDDEKDLLEVVKTHVDENKEPKVTISIDVADILAAQEAIDDWNKVKVGDKINIYLNELNVDVVAQIREINVNFEEHTLSFVISTVRNYNKGFGNFVLKTIRNLHNSNANNVQYELDGSRYARSTSETVNNVLENGLNTNNTTLSSGLTDDSGNTGTVVNGSGTTTASIQSVDPFTETVTAYVNTNTEGVIIADGKILSYHNYTSPTTYRSEIEISAGTGFTIRKIASGTTTKQVYIDTEGNASFAGKLVAPSGEIGGWTVDAKRLYAGSTTTRVELNADSLSDYAIFAGNESAASAPFSVKKDGTLVATSATITGAINATSGTFNNTITVGTDTNTIKIVGASTDTDTKIYSGVGTYNDPNTGFYLDASGRFSLGDQLYWDGAGNLQILGNLVADTGTIGGFTITADTIQQGADTTKLALQSDGTNPFLTIGQATNGYNETGIFLGLDSSTPKLSLKSGSNSLLFDGTNLSLTGSITATSGEIAGWSINSTRLFKSYDAGLTNNVNIYTGELPSAISTPGAGEYGFAVENTNPSTDYPFLTAMTNKGFYVFTNTDAANSYANPISAMEISYNEDYIWAKGLLISDNKNIANANVSIGTLAVTDGAATNWGLKVNNGDATDGSSVTIDKDGIEIIKTASSVSTTTFSVDTSGNVAVKGDLTASTGTFGATNQGHVIIGDSSNPLQVKSDTTSILNLTSTGTLTFAGFTASGTALYTGTKSTFASNDAGVYLASDGIALGSNSPFKVTNAGVLTASSGTIGGWNLDTDAIYTGTKTATGNYTSTAGHVTIGSDGHISAKEFRIDSDGNAFFAGDISAATGTFGASIAIGTGDSIFKADSNGIYLGDADFADAEFSVTPDGLLKAQSGTVGGWTLGATTLTGTNITLNRGGVISLGTGNNVIVASNVNGLYMGNSSQASAPFSVTLAGVLKATSGTVGGWTLGASSLTGGDATLSSSGNLTLGTSDDVVRLSADDATYRLWAGAATAASAPFRVDKDGNLVATAATIEGAVTATSGSFTGAITANSGSIEGTLTMGSSGEISIDNGDVLINNTGINIGSGAITIDYANGGIKGVDGSSNVGFNLGLDGTGSIGGFNYSYDYLRAGTDNTKLLLKYDATNPYLSIKQATNGYGNDGIFLGIASSNPKFSMVTDSGNTFLKYDPDPSATYDLEIAGNAKVGPLFVGNDESSVTALSSGSGLTRYAGQTIQLDANSEFVSFNLNDLTGVEIISAAYNFSTLGTGGTIGLSIDFYGEENGVDYLGSVQETTISTTSGVFSEFATFVRSFKPKSAVVTLGLFANTGASIPITGITLSAYKPSIQINNFTVNSFGDITGTRLKLVSGDLTADRLVISNQPVGTNSRQILLSTPSSALSQNRIIRLPDEDGIVATFATSKTFRGTSGIKFESSSSEDSIVIKGRAGGSNSYTATLIPDTLTGFRTLTLPDATGTLALQPTGTAYTNSVYGGNGEWRYVAYAYESTDQSLTAATDVLSITIPRAGEYRVFMSGAYYSTSTTIGIQAKFTYTADPGQSGLSTVPDPVFNWTISQSATASNGDLHNKTGMNTAITSTSVSATNTDHGFSCIGFFRTLGSGTFYLNIAPETGSTSVGVAEGTVLYVEELIN